MQLVLIGARELVDAWTAEFVGVEIVEGRFQDHLGTYDALVSPGNSYGQMDGGIDGAISAEFGAVQRNVWRMLAERHHGYQPVGTAEVVETGDPRCPFLVHAPTMRMPMRLRGAAELHVYDALWAALLAADRHGDIGTLACPGLGTGVGGVAPERAAQLMGAAYRHWRSSPDLPISQRESDLE